MRLAVKEILGDAAIQTKLGDVAEIVKLRLEEGARETLAKLHELNPQIASTLNPRIAESRMLKWIDVFKNVAIAGDEEISINKGGSGIKRLVLISFFRAEAERRQREAGLPSVVYAIEEPETSHHPEHQRALMSALIALSEAQETQILLTSHSPEIVKQLRFENLLLVAGRDAAQIRRIQESELPYASLNEANFAAFHESTSEYHNELYGFIEAGGHLAAFVAAKPTMEYDKLRPDGTTVRHQVVLTE